MEPTSQSVDTVKSDWLDLECHEVEQLIAESERVKVCAQLVLCLLGYGMLVLVLGLWCLCLDCAYRARSGCKHAAITRAVGPLED